MTASIVDNVSELRSTTYQFFGEVKLYVERSGVMHGVHEGSCLKCGESEEWIAEYTPLVGTLTSPAPQAYGSRPGYVTL